MCRRAVIGKNGSVPALFLLSNTKKQEAIIDFWYFKRIKSHISRKILPNDHEQILILGNRLP